VLGRGGLEHNGETGVRSQRDFPGGGHEAVLFQAQSHGLGGGPQFDGFGRGSKYDTVGNAHHARAQGRAFQANPHHGRRFEGRRGRWLGWWRRCRMCDYGWWRGWAVQGHGRHAGPRDDHGADADGQPWPLADFDRRARDSSAHHASRRECARLGQHGRHGPGCHRRGAAQGIGAAQLVVRRYGVGKIGRRRQGGAHVVHGLEALVRLLGQHAQHGLFDIGRHLRRELAQGGRRFVQVHAEQLAKSLGHKRWSACE
jgi:hypothetical protein